MATLLAISSSPRRNGNSELLLNSFVQGVEKEGWQTTTVRINNLNYRPCQACDRCAVDGRCVLQDDMQKIYPLVIASEAIVVATPIYFGTVAAQLKMLIDRFQSWWHAKYGLKKPFVAVEEGRKGFFICVGALKNKKYCENASDVVKVFYHNINFAFAGRLCYQGFDHKGAIREDPEALEQAFQAGQQFATK